MPEFLQFAFLSGIIIALVSGPLGSFVAWQRLSFFGHTLAHSALIGVALGLFFDTSIVLSVSIVSIVLSILLSWLYSFKSISRDTWMALIAHGSLGISLVMISVFPDAQRFIQAYLFGDILALTVDDILILFITSIIVSVILFFLWNPILRITINEGIARAEGVPIFLVRTVFMILVAIIVSVAVKVLGGLLITAMLIIPAATARRLVFSPEQMSLVASILGVVSVIVGITTAGTIDTPPAATIVVVSLLLFFVSRIVVWRRDF